MGIEGLAPHSAGNSPLSENPQPPMSYAGGCQVVDRSNFCVARKLFKITGPTKQHNSMTWSCTWRAGSLQVVGTPLCLFENKKSESLVYAEGKDPHARPTLRTRLPRRKSLPSHISERVPHVSRRFGNVVWLQVANNSKTGYMTD